MKSTGNNDTIGQVLKSHNLRKGHLKVACLPIPPYAQRDSENRGIMDERKVKNGSGRTVGLTGSAEKKPSKLFQKPFQKLRPGRFLDVEPRGDLRCFQIAANR